MANFKLSQTAKANLMTDFRFSIRIAQDSANSNLGLTEDVTGYIQTCTLPCAPMEPIYFMIAGGKRSVQAGRRTTQPIELSFVISSEANGGSILKTLEKWANCTFSLETGTNVGKAKYCTDAITIECRGEDDTIKYTAKIIRGILTNCSYGNLSSEGNNLIRVSMTLAYDNYKILDANGNDLKGLT